jgi:hypothetical protein
MVRTQAPQAWPPYAVELALQSMRTVNTTSQRTIEQNCFGCSNLGSRRMWTDQHACLVTC